MTDLEQALAPVRRALLAAAHAEADLMSAEAEAEAATVLAEARRQADEILAEARAQGTADGSAALATERAHIHRQAHAVVLAARREVYELWRSEARVAVAQLAGEPAVRERLVEAAQAALGPGVAIHDAAGGGITAQAGGQVLDLSLTGFADRAVDALAVELEDS
jgi:vacuolar-type H+-ATPase subunit E/Vma4